MRVRLGKRLNVRQDLAGEKEWRVARYANLVAIRKNRQAEVGRHPIDRDPSARRSHERPSRTPRVSDAPDANRRLCGRQRQQIRCAPHSTAPNHERGAIERQDRPFVFVRQPQMRHDSPPEATKGSQPIPLGTQTYWQMPPTSVPAAAEVAQPLEQVTLMQSLRPGKVIESPDG
jgi:hypothetical protein